MKKQEKSSFKGEVIITPILSEQEILFIKKFSEMKHVKRHNGPYFVENLTIENQKEHFKEIKKDETESNTKKQTKKTKKQNLDAQLIEKINHFDNYGLETKKYPTDGSDIIDHNRAHDGKPGLWCRWTVNQEGSAIIWDGHDDFYNASDWLAYLINHFIGTQPMAKTATSLTFLNKHTLNGIIDGIEEGEKIKIIVKDNIVKTQYL